MSATPIRTHALRDGRITVASPWGQVTVADVSEAVRLASKLRSLWRQGEAAVKEAC